ncbi:hypothetical protein HOU09_gp299 [Dickeya phage vB_DsoM_AD1]|uniref:Uncharacterized protein n=1 Tax=Dickeya phage vB_DsoM_AD1 TaxID=2283029 RepID=A0A384ZYJ8_9CAUD|nr:hypothetical protein HOU09_gp299 [Dickeya phage vB_DsoM_AD1]AXG67343.1 hypothetical protein AD1_299 [Dickeya phage vB_DsoM_AD1]
MAEITIEPKLTNKVRKALETCWNETTNRNEGPIAFSFLASSFAKDGKRLFEGELRLINAILREAININLYGWYVATVHNSKKGDMLIFQPVADLEDIVELEL